jgi:hypothetical protein
MESLKGNYPLYIGAGVLLLVIIAVAGKGSSNSAQVIRGDPNTIAAASNDYQASLKASTDLAAVNAGTQSKLLDTLLGYGNHGLDTQLGLYSKNVDGNNSANTIAANYALGSQQTSTQRALGLADIQATREQNGYNYHLGNSALQVQQTLGSYQYQLGLNTNSSNVMNTTTNANAGIAIAKDTNATNRANNISDNNTAQQKNAGDVFGNIIKGILSIFLPIKLG